MKKQFVFNLIASLILSCAIIAVVTGWYSWYSVVNMWDTQKQDILRQSETALLQLDLSLSTFEKEMDRIGIPATRELAHDVGNYARAKSLSPNELELLAKNYGLDHIFIINNEGIVVNTTYAPDRNLNLRKICSAFDDLTGNLYGRGQCVSTRPSFSSSSTLYKYFYFSPAGTDFIVETAIDFRKFVADEYSDNLFNQIFPNFAVSFEQNFQYVDSVDFISVSGNIARSYRDFGAVVHIPSDVRDELKTQATVTREREKDGFEIVYHRRQNTLTPGAAEPTDSIPRLAVLVLDPSVVSEYTYSLFLYLVVAICLTVMLAFMLLSPRLENIFRRLSAINANLANIAQGNYATHIDIGGEDEIATIAQNINLMGEEISRRETHLVESQSQLYESEERLQFALDAAHLGTWDWVLTSDQVLFDSHIAAMLELPEQGLPMRGILDHIHPEDRPSLIKHMRKLIGNHSEYYSSEFRLRRTSGHWLWVNGRGRIAEHHNGIPTRIVGTLQDIHASKTSELEHLEMETRLIQSQKMEAVGKLAGGISHDFNNLLQIIVGYTEMLKRDFEPDELPGIADEILQASERAMTLVRQLMTFSRSRDVMNQTSVNLNDLVERIGRMTSRVIPDTINFHTHTDSALPPVLADAGQIEQVLLNLCLNARDAMEEGGQLKISLRQLSLDTEAARLIPEAREGDYLEVSVADTGMGMDEEVVQRIFEPFFTTKPVGKGTGLGLATAYAIIRRHDGFIKVFSRKGTGTVFHVYLPIHPDAATATDSPIPAPTAQLRGSETILFAEDDDQIRRLATTILTKAGYTVIEAINGDHAIELFRQHQAEIDMLLFDVIMPGNTGPQAADAIDQLQPGLPIVYASGYSDVHLASNFDGILLHKPYQEETLLQAIRKVLDEAATDEAPTDEE